MDGHYSRGTTPEAKLIFVGSGVSGGEEGGLVSGLPSNIAWLLQDAWEQIRDVWASISAKVDSVPANRSKQPATGTPSPGACHAQPISERMDPTKFVKMVHNGIEYGDMQMICESFHLMSRHHQASSLEIGRVFDRWNEGELDSFLVEITGDILKQNDPRTGKPFVDVVMDAAGQAGLGKYLRQRSRHGCSRANGRRGGLAGAELR